MPPVAAIPTGTVTFLFTDVEASTRMWEDRPAAMDAALERHDAIMRAAIAEHGGYVFSTAGDAFSAAIGSPTAAADAVLAAQEQLAAEAWPEPVELRVRMGLHTGEAHERDGDYFGPTLNRAARLMSAGHGGQVLVSATTGGLLIRHDLLDLLTGLVDKSLVLVDDVDGGTAAASGLGCDARELRAARSDEPEPHG